MAWKVVRIRDGIFTSSIWDRPVQYIPNKWATPIAGDNPFLFVFSSRAQARLYTKTIIADRIAVGQRFRICKCKVKNLTPDRTLNDASMKAYYFPTGTMFADAVKLI